MRPVVIAAALLLLPAAAGAQRIHSLPPAAPSMVPVADSSLPPSAVGAFLASAVVPGAGQYRLGAGRWVAYAAVEAWGWINWLDARNEARDLEATYRDLAWSVARRISVGRRRDREFEYYEAMGRLAESGSFDADPTRFGLQPEQDTMTYNGEIWKLAREIYFPAGGESVPPSEEEQAAALDYYRRNAIAPEYAWSWGSNQLEHEQFRALIRESDDAARTGTTLLGVILVNHLVSAVDALLAARLRDEAGESGGLRLRSETRFEHGAVTPYLVVEIRTP